MSEENNIFVASKEGLRVCESIKANKNNDEQNSGVFVTSVAVRSVEEMSNCCLTVAKTYPETAVMLLSSFGRSMLVSTVTPSSSLREYLLLGDWIERSTKSVCVQGVLIKDTHPNADITVREISYAHLTNDYSPEKLVDQVMSNSFSFLRLKGLYIDPPEEREYNFDDLEE